MDDTVTLKSKIEKYQADIARLEAKIAVTADDTFGRIRVVEMKSTVKDYLERIERLRSRIAGTVKPGPSDYQISCAEYVNSSTYDND
jgi:acyl-coenzyme A synthetase/AMP-(fatty) acid ligase